MHFYPGTSFIALMFNRGIGYTQMHNAFMGLMNMRDIRSVTIGLPVVDIDNAIKWYRMLLGSVEEMNPVPGVWEFNLAPAVWLQLFEVDNSEPNPSVLRLESSDIRSSHKLASTLGTNVTDVETVPDMVSYFDFRDPFGNQLSFYQLTDSA